MMIDRDDDEDEDRDEIQTSDPVHGSCRVTLGIPWNEMENLRMDSVTH